MENIEQKAAAALLNKGIKVPVTAPLLFRLFGKATIEVVIKQPMRGTLHQMSAVYLATGITPEDLAQIGTANIHELNTRYGKAIDKMVAYAWLNGNLRGRLFAGIVSRWLSWHLTSMQMLTLWNVIAVLSGSEAFTNTIKLSARMRTTAPNLSQTMQGS